MIRLRLIGRRLRLCLPMAGGHGVGCPACGWLGALAPRGGWPPATALCGDAVGGPVMPCRRPAETTPPARAVFPSRHRACCAPLRSGSARRACRAPAAWRAKRHPLGQLPVAPLHRRPGTTPPGGLRCCALAVPAQAPAGRPQLGLGSQRLRAAPLCWRPCALHDSTQLPRLPRRLHGSTFSLWGHPMKLLHITGRGGDPPHWNEISQGDSLPPNGMKFRRGAEYPTLE